MKSHFYTVTKMKMEHTENGWINAIAALAEKNYVPEED